MNGSSSRQKFWHERSRHSQEAHASRASGNAWSALQAKADAMATLLAIIAAPMAPSGSATSARSLMRKLCINRQRAREMGPMARNNRQSCKSSRIIPASWPKESCLSTNYAHPRCCELAQTAGERAQFETRHCRILHLSTFSGARIRFRRLL